MVTAQCFDRQQNEAAGCPQRAGFKLKLAGHPQDGLPNCHKRSVEPSGPPRLLPASGTLSFWPRGPLTLWPLCFKPP